MEKSPRLGLRGVRDVLNDRCSENRCAIGFEDSSLECSFVWKCTDCSILPLKKCKESVEENPLY